MTTNMKVYSLMVSYRDPDGNVYPEHSGVLYATADAAQKAADARNAEAPEWFDYYRNHDEYDHPYAFVEPLEVLE